MATVSDLAKQLDVSPTTIRAWTDEFARYLSPQAVPPSGQTRVYNPEDVGVLGLVASLRADGQQHEAICSALDSGARAEPEEVTESDTGGISLRELRESLVKSNLDVARWEGRYSALEGERDRLITERDEARAEADRQRERATAAETRLAGVQPPATETQVTAPASPKAWWRRLFGG